MNENMVGKYQERIIRVQDAIQLKKPDRIQNWVDITRENGVYK